MVVQKKKKGKKENKKLGIHATIFNSWNKMWLIKEIMWNYTISR
jgi:hypothetical protein